MYVKKLLSGTNIERFFCSNDEFKYKCWCFNQLLLFVTFELKLQQWEEHSNLEENENLNGGVKWQSSLHVLAVKL